MNIVKLDLNAGIWTKVGDNITSMLSIPNGSDIVIQVRAEGGSNATSLGMSSLPAYWAGSAVVLEVRSLKDTTVYLITT